MPIGAQAAGLYAAGYRFALRTVAIANGPTTGVITGAESVQIRAAGLALGIYQLFRNHNFTAEVGAIDGQAAVAAARAVGYPDASGLPIWCDLEGTLYAPGGAKITSKQTVITYLQGWVAAVQNGGFVPGLYNGPQALVGAADLSSLGIGAFWKSATNVPAPARGYQMFQGRANIVVSGVNIDEDTTAQDGEGNLATFWAPSST